MTRRVLVEPGRDKPVSFALKRIHGRLRLFEAGCPTPVFARENVSKEKEENTYPLRRRQSYYAIFDNPEHTDASIEFFVEQEGEDVGYHHDLKSVRAPCVVEFGWCKIVSRRKR